MARTDPVLIKVRQICLALPNTKETLTWGKPHFRVGEHIFAGYTDEDTGKGGTGGPVIGFKLEKAPARAILEDSRFRPAPYVGRYGWVSMDAAGITDWNENTKNELKKIIKSGITSFKMFMIYKSQGWLATDPIGQEKTGKYFERMRPVRCRFGEDRAAAEALFAACQAA